MQRRNAFDDTESCDNLRILVLDANRLLADVIRRWHPNTVWVPNALECVQALSEPFDLVVLSYELSGDWVAELNAYDNGLTVVMHIIQNRPRNLWTTHFIVRTSADERAGLMITLLKKARYDVE